MYKNNIDPAPKLKTRKSIFTFLKKGTFQRKWPK